MSHERSFHPTSPANVRPSLLAFVKANGLSRAQLDLVIEDLAAAKRMPGRSRKQSYNDFIMTDALGIELYRIYAESAGPRQD